MKLAARAALIAMLAAALYGLHRAPMTMTTSLWPLDRHTNVLAFGVVLSVYAVLLVAALYVLIRVVWTLGETAEWWK